MVAVQRFTSSRQLRKQKMMQHASFAESGGGDDAVRGLMAEDVDEVAAPAQLNPPLPMREGTQPAGELVRVALRRRLPRHLLKPLCCGVVACWPAFRWVAHG